MIRLSLFLSKIFFFPRTCIIHKNSIIISQKISWQGYTKSSKPRQMMREPTVLQYNNTIQGGKLECLEPPATYLIIHF